MIPPVFIAAVEELGYCDLQILLKSLISNAGGSLEKLEKNIMFWYEEYMNRVSGWYKIKVQKRLFILALPVAIIMNLDFFAISTSLLNDRSMTAQIANIAETYKPVQIDSIKNEAELKRAIDMKNSLLDSLNKMRIPILWQKQPPTALKWQELPFKFLGWLIMAVAMSFGSPFWFELLNKLVNIRKTGIKPALLTMPGNDEKTNQ